MGKRLSERVKAATGADSSANYETTNGRSDMDDNTAGEVLRAKVVEPAVCSPQPVGDGVVTALARQWR